MAVAPVWWWRRTVPLADAAVYTPLMSAMESVVSASMVASARLFVSRGQAGGFSVCVRLDERFVVRRGVLMAYLEHSANEAAPRKGREASVALATGASVGR
tara:strand:- start:391 stop:693 length:303 start_codon:yes stop_codon:yes gene_type:complete